MNSLCPLEIKDLSFGYKYPLTTHLHLTIKENEFITIMGENGCGKTTLIDCFLGFHQPVSGEILFWQIENKSKNRKQINQKVGWVLSQKENYPFYVDINNYLKIISSFYLTWDWKLCNQLCESFGINTQKKLSHLSMGEHSKLRLIKAISFRPQLIVLDELTANLFPTSKEALLSTLLEIFVTEKMAALYICHSNEEALRLSDRVYKMDQSGLSLQGGQNV